MLPNVCFHSPFRSCEIVPQQEREKRAQTAFTKGCLSKELLYTCIRNHKNSQVIPQTAPSLRFEHQKNVQTIKNGIAGVQRKADHKRTFVSLMQPAGVSTAGGNHRWTLHTIGSLEEQLNDHSVTKMLFWVLFLIPVARWFKLKCIVVLSVLCLHNMTSKTHIRKHTRLIFCKTDIRLRFWIIMNIHVHPRPPARSSSGCTFWTSDCSCMISTTSRSVSELDWQDD